MNSNDSQVYLVEDDIAISKALEALFDSVKIKVSSFHDPRVFLEKFNHGQVKNGCIILDIRLPGISGIEVQEQLNKQNNVLPIVFITAHGDIDMAVRAMKAGAFDFVTKPFSNQNLLTAVQKSFVKLQDSIKSIEFREKLYKLTPRESEIIHYIVSGKMNKEISYALNIAISTVEIHRANIMKKLSVRNIAELISHYVLATSNLGCKY